MIKVLETSIDLDLSLFSRYLWQMGISHRIFEESGQQQLCVKTSEQADAVLELYKEYLSGELKLEAAASADIPEGPSTLQRVLMQMRLYPGTMIFILISAVLIHCHLVLIQASRWPGYIGLPTPTLLFRANIFCSHRSCMA